MPHRLAGEQLCRQGAAYFCGQVDRVSAKSPRSDEVQQHPGLHQRERSQQMKRRAGSLPAGTREAAPGVLCSGLDPPAQEKYQCTEMSPAKRR